MGSQAVNQPIVKENRFIKNREKQEQAFVFCRPFMCLLDNDANLFVLNMCFSISSKLFTLHIYILSNSELAFSTFMHYISCRNSVYIEI